ncbi:MAG: methyltransferase [Fibrobacter sp.]|nr:methyltransferase [Fibrobacter sp.]
MPILPSEKLLSQFAPFQPVNHCPEIKAHQAIDFFKFWEALELESNKQCIPFWGCVWPGARLLARFILDHRDDFKGKRVLDFGCGCGVATIAAVMAHAESVIANDIDQTALYITSRNLNENSSEAILEQANLLFNRDLCREPDVILVSDMFYERSTADALLSFLLDFHRNGTEVIIADGGRPFTPKSDIEVIASATLVVDKEIEGVEKRDVRLLKFK